MFFGVCRHQNKPNKHIVVLQFVITSLYFIPVLLVLSSGSCVVTILKTDV